MKNRVITLLIEQCPHCFGFFLIFLSIISLHLSLSPSGCTFWGKKPWSRKKKILWQLGTLVGAPVGIALIAGIAIPAMIIGIPVYVGRKVRLWRHIQFLKQRTAYRVHSVSDTER